MKLLCLVLLVGFYSHDGYCATSARKCDLHDPNGKMTPEALDMCCERWLDWEEQSKKKPAFELTAKQKEFWASLEDPDMKFKKGRGRKKRQADVQRFSPNGNIFMRPFGFTNGQQLTMGQTNVFNTQNFVAGPRMPSGLTFNQRPQINFTSSGFFSLNPAASRISPGGGIPSPQAYAENTARGVTVEDFGIPFRRIRIPPQPLIRREYRTIPQEERDRFHRAINRLKSINIDGLSLYDIFTYYHQASSGPAAHFGPSFWPWHREMLLR